MTTSSVKASSTSIAAVKTTIASTTVVSTSVKLSSSSAPVATSTKASSTVVSATKAAATTSIANWTWLWDPSYIFNMWNNFNAFRELLSFLTSSLSLADISACRMGQIQRLQL